jgi:hypothetical protein
MSEALTEASQLLVLCHNLLRKTTESEPGLLIEHSVSSTLRSMSTSRDEVLDDAARLGLPRPILASN